MSPAPPLRRTRRAAIGLIGALAVCAVAAPAAPAAFSILPCTGVGVLARGATFQTDAILNAFIPAFRSSAQCGSGAAGIGYDAFGSGAGRRALGERDAATNPNQDRDPAVRFAASDEPPTPAQRAQMEGGPIDANGVDVTPADDGKLHVIPVAIGANTVMVHLPDTCADFGTTPLFLARPKIDANKIEAMFAGDASADTWGEVLTGASAGCASASVKRVVRLDSSGTSFALKQYLARINPARGWAGLSNTQWPNDSGSTAVVRGDSNGGGPLRQKLDATPGGIGYADLATARGSNGNYLYDSTAGTTATAVAYDNDFYLPVEIQHSGVWRDPQINAEGYLKNTGAGTDNDAGGANCFNASVQNPGADTLGDWSQTDSTFSPDAGSGDYNACTLTYELMFDDNSTVYCNSAAEERKARTVKDFIDKGVLSNGSTSSSGQGRLRGANYAELPAAILAKSRAGAALIGWKDGTDGRPCSVPPTNTNTTTTVTNTVFVPGTTPPVAAPSNAFTITSARYSRNRVRVALQLPGAGTFTVSPTATPKRGRSIGLSRSTTTVTSAGTQRVSFTLNAKAKKALKRFGSIKVRVAVSYTPTGGAAARKTRTLTIKGPKR